MKKNILQIIIIILLIILIIITVGVGVYFIATNNESNSNNFENNNNSNININEEITIDYKIIDKANSIKHLVVNNNEVEIDSLSITVNKLSDALFVSFVTAGSTRNCIVDKNGNIITDFIANNSYLPNAANYTIKISGNVDSSYTVNGNKLKVISYISQDPNYSACEANDDTTIKYVESFNYIGKGKFEKESTDYIKAKQYINENNLKCD